ncbi:aspartate aminotransferase family protein [Desmospora profundinema]|uniref:4-aminobutyrate aminotransferase n=1 Tax=Desmospora profundinema TaxID=1571184 RepID=A0ABU1ITW0_9BACL|nr:aminotransferase class III-fold pyridoxal phosphate-dependent enzyme [Desmospora profundinema]MDR6227354.1 4-aminobutyrate aminotransferase [Desmospora profundinema]
MKELVSQADWKDYLSPVWPHFSDIMADRGMGAALIDQNGDRYLDFTSGIGVTNTGHCHPRVVKAIQNQAEKLLHGQATIFYHKPMQDLVTELRQVVPSSLNSFFFSNSGSEAVESAIKLARHATGRTNLICFQGGYHGRTVGAMSVTTAKRIYRLHYQPLMPGVIVAPFPSSEEETERCLEALEQLLFTQTAPAETAAMIVEPVLGEGGYMVPSATFLQGLRSICDQHGILLILDEVQSGFGRTGTFFAFEHFRILPDILIMAKGMASGLPLSGIASSRERMEKWIQGSHGGTYGGNPLACAAAAETIRVIHDEHLVERSAKAGRQLVHLLQAVTRTHPSLVEVRGLGLMVGCEFRDGNGKPDGKKASEIRRRCLEKGLLLLTCGTHDHVIRWIPPLVVTEQELHHAVSLFAESVAETGDRLG